MRALALLALGGVLLAGSALANGVPAGDPEAGRKVAGLCRTCHGLDGRARIPVAPHIGGEPASYLARQLRAFRSGERVNEMMSVVAGGLDDRQIADVAAWYAGQHATATLRADPSGAPRACVPCHGADGIATDPDAPNLAGETNIYIETQLKAFRSARRFHEVMTDIAAGLSDEEIRAAANWYAAIDLEITTPE